MTSSASEVAVEIRATIAVVRLMRPAKRNALSDALMAEIDAAFAALPKSVGCAVLTGSGDHFSAGLDLSKSASAMLLKVCIIHAAGTAFSAISSLAAFLLLPRCTAQ